MDIICQWIDDINHENYSISAMICYNWSLGEELRPSILTPLCCGQRQKQNNMINNTSTSLAFSL